MGCPQLPYQQETEYLKVSFRKELSLVKSVWGGCRTYELKDHLGNVRAVVSDHKILEDENSNHAIDAGDYYSANVVSFSDYFPFGMLARNGQVGDARYRYSYNGKEGDDEVKGKGNQVDFGARVFDVRLGRWFAPDPLEAKYPSSSTYVGIGNNPIIYVDTDGRDIIYFKWVCSNCNDPNVNKSDRPSEGNEIDMQFKPQLVTSNELNSRVVGAMKKFIQTKQGLAYIKRYLKEGQSFAGYVATEDGDLSDHILMIGQDNGDYGRLGQTNPDLAVVLKMDISTALGVSVGKVGAVQPENMTKVQKINSKGYQLATMITLYPYTSYFDEKAMSEEQISDRLGYAMGHEAFIHASASWTLFTSYFVSGNFEKGNSFLKEYYSNVENSDGTTDHSNYINGINIPSIKMMQSFQSQYEKVVGEKTMKSYKKDDNETYKTLKK